MTTGDLTWLILWRFFIWRIIILLITQQHIFVERWLTYPIDILNQYFLSLYRWYIPRLFVIKYFGKMNVLFYYLWHLLFLKALYGIVIIVFFVIVIVSGRLVIVLKSIVGIEDFAQGHSFLVWLLIIHHDFEFFQSFEGFRLLKRVSR